MKCTVALGSNLGDRLQNLRSARDRIAEMHGPLRCSKVYETEPVDCAPGASSFLNAVVEFDYIGDPKLLLDELRAIESGMGRAPSRERNAARTIDLDILLIGDLVFEDDTLVIPHPRIRSRRFVLAPLRDLNPNLIMPGESETVAELLAKLGDTPAIEVFANEF